MPNYRRTGDDSPELVTEEGKAGLSEYEAPAYYSYSTPDSGIANIIPAGGHAVGGTAGLATAVSN